MSQTVREPQMLIPRSGTSAIASNAAGAAGNGALLLLRAIGRWVGYVVAVFNPLFGLIIGGLQGAAGAHRTGSNTLRCAGVGVVLIVVGLAIVAVSGKL